MSGTSTLHSTLDELKHGQKAWARRDLEERILAVSRFSDLLEENNGALAKTLSDEVGKPLNEAVNEVNGARSRIGFFLTQSRQYLTDDAVRTGERIRYEPLGVVANISAWNYPYLVGVNVIVPALIAGNAVLYKPSEYATAVGRDIERILLEAGIPDNCFRCVEGGPSVGEEILELDCDGYFFTGSVKTGKLIAEKVATKLVPLGLELGGKDPIYVTDDVEDLDAAAESCVDGCFYNNGQSCCAIERLYVHQDVYEDFLVAFLKHTAKLGDRARLTLPEQVDFILGQIEDAKEKGAQVVAGGTAEDKLMPTVLVDVNHDMDLMREESFGPIIGIQKVSGDEEAFRLMDDTEFGLTAGVYCADRERARGILDKLDVGTAYINCCDRVSPYLPWSGRRNSGLGSTLSYLGIRAFTQPKAYHEH